MLFFNYSKDCTRFTNFSHHNTTDTLEPGVPKTLNMATACRSLPPKNLVACS